MDSAAKNLDDFVEFHLLFIGFGGEVIYNF